jgi:hypothetical protein
MQAVSSIHIYSSLHLSPQGSDFHLVKTDLLKHMEEKDGGARKDSKETAGRRKISALHWTQMTEGNREGRNAIHDCIR